MKCPSCKGEGGYTDVILEYGQGPYYPCNFCDDETTVKFTHWLSYQIIIFKDWLYDKFGDV